MRRSMMASVLLACGLLGGTPPAYSQVSASEALRQVEEGTFRSNDLNQDGRITRREMIVWVDLVFFSIDSNGDEQLSMEEWLIWDTGYVAAGRVAGREEDVQNAKRALFAELDLNGDGSIDQGEMSAANLYHFYKADRDRSGSLDIGEYTTDFLVARMLRAAVQGGSAAPAR